MKNKLLICVTAVMLCALLTLPVAAEETQAAAQPSSGTFGLAISVLDALTNQPIEGLECELFVVETDQVVAKWNTTEHPAVILYHLPYQFTAQMPWTADPEPSKIVYALRILNMPDGYGFHGQTTHGAHIIGPKSPGHQWILDSAKPYAIYLQDITPGTPEVTIQTGVTAPLLIPTPIETVAVAQTSATVATSIPMTTTMPTTVTAQSGTKEDTTTEMLTVTETGAVIGDVIYAPSEEKPAGHSLPILIGAGILLLGVGVLLIILKKRH